MVGLRFIVTNVVNFNVKITPGAFLLLAKPEPLLTDIYFFGVSW